MRQILANVPRYIIYNGAYVTLTKLEKKKNRQGETRYEAVTRTTVLGEKPRRHKQVIHMLGGGQSASANGARIKVDCDCEYHTFVCEVALARHGAADIIHSNGEFPYQTNPKGIPTACKHIYILLSAVVAGRK